MSLEAHVFHCLESDMVQLVDGGRRQLENTTFQDLAAHIAILIGKPTQVIFTRKPELASTLIGEFICVTGGCSYHTECMC